MTEVEKVSIGGYAFTLEKEAYAIVKQYLDELESHYSQREGGAEVMEGIEERMAELLYEKCADNGVASVAEINEIIATLGKPSAIESDDDPDLKKETVPGDNRREGKKRLYRDPTNKMLGGVCSGLAAYFKLDVVWFRIIFIGLTILGFSLHWTPNHWHVHSYGSFAILAYIILWIAMPEAKTVKQRWEMGVTNPPAGGKPVGSELGKVLRIIIGVVLLLMGVAGLTFGVAAIFGQELFGWDMVREGWEQLVDEIPFTMPLAGTLFYKLDLVLLYYLPMMGLIYAGIMLIFDLKSPSWRPGLVLFLLWVVVLVIFIVLTMMGLVRSELF
ncbi:MAG: PspC domain-containing protein [Bacteroidales bacterium]|jgi:phage shock protein PspC (stress-responsive transcriptional regulator)|nr:PspC domain-containing protein [Bacteroidales bacterium]